MFIAEKLGKYKWEIEEEMDLDEFSYWLAWFSYKNEEEQKQLEKAKRKRKS